LRLGSQRLAGGAALCARNAPAEASRGSDSEGGVRQSDPLPEPIGELPLTSSPAGRSGLQIARGLDLTYCTNIHPAEGWPAVFANLEKYAPALKQPLSPAAPFGV